MYNHYHHYDPYGSQQPKAPCVDRSFTRDAAGVALGAVGVAVLASGAGLVAPALGVAVGTEVIATALFGSSYFALKY